MPIYMEGLLWYLLLIDAIYYNIMAWSLGKWHERKTHWVSGYFPLDRFFGFVYFVLILWVGFALLRMDIILFR